jgi:dipeptide/tripeptide permease
MAIGNGLYKGNLQAFVGQMYDDLKYDKVRDNAFLIFYMGINVGAFFAPFAAMGIRNWWLKANGFLHDGSIPALCHQYKDGTLQDVGVLQKLADAVSLMLGGWLLATAVGNKLLFIGSFFWEKIELWQLWSIFVVTCLLSAAFIFSI